MRLSLGPNGDMQAHIKSADSDTEHAVRVPLTENGVRFLHHLLVQQTKAPQAKIGTLASPTQQDADLWLRRDAAKKADAAYPDIDRSKLKVSL